MSRYDADRYEQLFGDGWREPGDDIERLSYTLMILVTFLAGSFFFFGSPIFAMAGPHKTAVWRFVASFVFGGLFAGFSLPHLIKEWRQLDRREMTADRVVAGGICVGFAVSMMGLMAMRSAHASPLPTIILMALGVGLMILWMLVGLACAYGGGRLTSRDIPISTILERYAINGFGEQMLDISDPASDGLQGWIDFRSPQGRRYSFRAAPAAYRASWMTAGTGGGRVAIVRWGVIREIRRSATSRV